MTPMRLGTVALACAVVIASALTGCTQTSASVAAPTLRSVKCPDDVELVILAPHSCMRLRVPEDRRHAAGRSVDLFVVRFVPPGLASPDPMLVLGNEVGDTLGYGSLSAVAERVHRVAYLLDTRGTGHSGPSMACPEANQVRATTTGEAAALGVAAHLCLARLRAAGDDPAWFGPKDVAADADALRRAVGVPRWNVITYGSSSVYAAELVQTHPATVRSLVVDSPAPFASQYAGTGATWAAWTSVATACRAQAACAHAFPDVKDLWREVAQRLALHPVPTGAGLLDPDALARLVRAMLAGDGPQATAQVPATLAGLLRGQLSDEATARLTSDHGACLGYRPVCTQANSLAVYLTAFCPLLTATNGAAGPVFPGAEALDPANMFSPACTGWAAAPAATGQLPSALPTLVFYGAADPFIDSAALDSWAHRPYAYPVDVPGQTHNAIGFNDCPIAIRNAWVDQPTSPPPNDCLASMPQLPFTTR